MKLTDTSTITRSPEVVFQEVSGELVLLDLESEQYFGLDEVGTRAWQLLGEAGDFGSLVTRLLGEYEVAEAELRRDLEALIGELDREGLVAVAD